MFPIVERITQGRERQMTNYLKFRSNSKPEPRNMVLKFAGKCACCGAEIKMGEWATYWPRHSLGIGKAAAVSHVGGLDGTSSQCTATLRQQLGANSYAGDGLDSRYEDQCAEICGR